MTNTRPTLLLVVLLLVVLLLSCVTACKQRGDVKLELTFPEDCRKDATHVRVYAVREGNCDCRCGECIADCTSETCLVGCRGGFCTWAELEKGVWVEPDIAGRYAVAYQSVRLDDSGTAAVLGTACAELELERDGTRDRVLLCDKLTGVRAVLVQQTQGAGPSHISARMLSPELGHGLCARFVACQAYNLFLERERSSFNPSAEPAMQWPC